MQYEADNEHVPLSHKWEQHSVLPAQGLPAVLHAVLSGWHKPAAQVPLQQVADDVQAALSATQVDTLDAQKPPTQERLQQSVANWHGKPGSKHCATEEAQVPVLMSQSPKQQVWPPVHEAPPPRHTYVASRAEPSPYWGVRLSLATVASPVDAAPPPPSCPPVPACLPELLQPTAARAIPRTEAPIDHLIDSLDIANLRTTCGTREED